MRRRGGSNTIYLNGNWEQVNSFNDAVKIIEKNMGYEFAQEFNRRLRLYIEEAKEIAIEEECEQCPYLGNG